MRTTEETVIWLIPCNTNFADWRSFCVLQELIFANGRNCFFLLGINFCDFQEVAFYLEF